MKGKILFVAGLAVGYVLGTKAGRERYEQISSAASRFWNSKTVQKRVDVVEDFVKDRTPEVVDFVGDSAKKLVDKVTGAAKQAPKKPATKSPATRKPAAKKPTAGPGSSSSDSTS